MMFQLELNLFHSAKGNNQFVKLPYKVPKDDLCTIVDGIFIKSSCARDLADSSDFPAPIKNESLCAAYKTVTKIYLTKKMNAILNSNIVGKLHH